MYIYILKLGKIKLSHYLLLQVSCVSNLQVYTMFIYLKRQLKLTFRTIIQDKQNIWANITCNLHSVINIYSNIHIC